MPLVLSALALLLCTSLATAGSLTAGAPRLVAPSSFLAAQDAPPEISANQAAQRAQELNGGGKILAVDAVPGGYRVKLLKDGEVKIVFVPN